MNDRRSAAPSGTPSLDEQLREAREALQRANARMENMLESMADGFCAIGHDWRIGYINGRALDMLAPLRMTRPNLVGHDLWETFPALSGTRLEGVLRHTMDSREPAAHEFYFPALKHWFEVRVHPSPDGLTVYLQDIDGRKADQQELVQSNNRLQLALAAGRLGDWRWDAPTDQVELGERAAEIFGLPANTPLAWSELRARLDPADREPMRRAVLQAFAGHGDLELECRLLHDGDEPRWLALVGRTVYANPARREGLLGVTGVVQTSRRAAAPPTPCARARRSCARWPIRFPSWPGWPRPTAPSSGSTNPGSTIPAPRPTRWWAGAGRMSATRACCRS